MMEELEKLCLDSGMSINYRYVNLGGKVIYIEGIKSVTSFGLEEMRFQLKKQSLKVLGANLRVKYLDKTTCVINGDIKAVEVL